MDPNMFNRFPRPILAPIDIDNMLGDCRERLGETADYKSRVVHKNLDCQNRIVTGSWERIAGIQIILVKRNIRLFAAVAFGVFKLFRTQIQGGDFRVREKLCQQTGNTTKATTYFQDTS